MKKKPLKWSSVKDEAMVESSRGPSAATKGPYFLSAIEPYLPSRFKNFLSIGAGTGDAEIFLSKHWNCPFGFQDYSPTLAQAFKEKIQSENLKPLEIVVGRFEDCEFQHSYDLILSFHAWYYIPITPTVMQKLRDLLQPGGRAIIAIHRKNNFVFELNSMRDIPPLEISADDLYEAAKPYFHAKLHSWIDHWPPNTLFDGDQITPKGRSIFKFSLERESDQITPEEIKRFKVHTDKFTDSNGTRLDYGIVELNLRS